MMGIRGKNVQQKPHLKGKQNKSKKPHHKAPEKTNENQTQKEATSQR
jgi:hypothetical protein